MTINTILDPLHIIEQQSIDKITSEYGVIDINPNPKYSPIPYPSIVNLYVEPEYRKKGAGTALVKQALNKYKNLSGQVNSISGLRTLYSAGMRPFNNKNASYDESETMYWENESLLMVTI